MNRLRLPLGWRWARSFFSIDLEQATQTLSTALPYLREVQVGRRLPATLVVSVQPAHETYAVAYEGGWAVVSEDLKVLRLSAEQPQDIAAVTGLEASAPAEGQPLQVAQADKMEAPANSAGPGPGGRAGTADSHRYDKPFGSERRICRPRKITFGTMNDIEYKCSWAARLLLGEDDSAMIGEHETGTLDVSHRTQDGKGQAIWRRRHLTWLKGETLYSLAAAKWPENGKPFTENRKSIEIACEICYPYK